MSHPYRNKPPEEWPAPRPFGDWLGSAISGWWDEPRLSNLGAAGVLLFGIFYAGITSSESSAQKAIANRDAVLLREVAKMATGPCRDARLLLEDRAGVVCPHADHVMAAATDKAVRCVCRRK